MFIGLGLWQLDRAAQKQVIKDKVMQRSETPVRVLPFEMSNGSEHEHYQYKFTGVFEPKYQILLDNQIHQGQAGYLVITPIKMPSTETRVLVNRGWIPWGASRETLPTIPTPDSNFEITGRAVVPPTDYFTLENESNLSADWTTRWQNLDMEKIQSQLPFTVYPIVIQLDADADAGFVRDWPNYDDHWIQRHRGYAFHWFSFAVLLIVIWIVFIIRARRSKQA